MDLPNPERIPDIEPEKQELASFLDKMGQLLPNMEFRETVEMLEARTAVLEALRQPDQNPELLNSVWAEYKDICEQTVDSTPTRSNERVQLQIAVPDA